MYKHICYDSSHADASYPSEECSEESYYDTPYPYAYTACEASYDEEWTPESEWDDTAYVAEEAEFDVVEQDLLALELNTVYDMQQYADEACSNDQIADVVQQEAVAYVAWQGAMGKGKGKSKGKGKGGKGTTITRGESITGEGSSGWRGNVTIS